MGNRCDDSLLNHVIKCLLYLFPVFEGYLSLGMLDWENTGVCPDGVGPRHVANGVKGVGVSSLQPHYVPDLDCHHEEIFNVLFCPVTNKRLLFCSSMSFISSSYEVCHVYNEWVQSGMNDMSVLYLYSAKPTCSYQHCFSKSTDWSRCMLCRALHFSWICSPKLCVRKMC